MEDALPSYRAEQLMTRTWVSWLTIERVERELWSKFCSEW